MIWLVLGRLALLAFVIGCVVLQIHAFRHPEDGQS